METTDKNREQRLRRRAKREGLRLEKSRVRNTHLDDFGLYWLIDPAMNAVAFAPRHDATLDAIEGFLEESLPAIRSAEDMIEASHGLEADYAQAGAK